MSGDRDGAPRQLVRDRSGAIDRFMAMTEAELRRAIEEWMSSTRAVERVMAARALQFDAAPVRDLRTLLDDPDAWVRAEAFLVLTQRVPKQALRQLRKVDVDSSSAKVREAAMGGVAFLAADADSKELRAILRRGMHDPAASVRSWAFLGMASVSKVTAKDIALAVDATRRSRSVEVRLEALELLVQHAPTRARPVFVRELARAALPPGVVTDLARRLAGPAELDALHGYWGQLTTRERADYGELWHRLLDGIVPGSALGPAETPVIRRGRLAAGQADQVPKRSSVDER